MVVPEVEIVVFLYRVHLALISTLFCFNVLVFAVEYIRMVFVLNGSVSVVVASHLLDQNVRVYFGFVVKHLLALPTCVLILNVHFGVV